MTNILNPLHECQPHTNNSQSLSQSHNTGAIDCNTELPLNEFFLRAVEQNKLYYASREGTHRYTSPLFRLVQLLRSYPALKDCTADDAFGHLTNEVKPNWEQLFPNVPIPSLEFLTAWEQINIPAGVSLWQIVEERVRKQPLTLLAPRICDGYEYYLAIAFHLQRLTPRKNIMLPVKHLSGLLTVLLGKQVSVQSVSYYCRQAKTDGYLMLLAKAHHPSGKAAKYNFDLTRFTETGLELPPDATDTQSDATVFSYGSKGIQGIEGIGGIEGSSGTQESDKSVLSHASSQEYILNKPEQGEEIQPIETLVGEEVIDDDNETKNDDKYKQTYPDFVPHEQTHGAYTVDAAVDSPKKVAQSGWMSAGKPLPKALMPIPDNTQLKTLINASTEGNLPLKGETHVNTVVPTSAKAGVLGEYWKARLDELWPNKYHASPKKEEFGMLAHLGRYLGDEAGRVIDYVLRHWKVFGWQALNDNGVKSYPPEEPNIAFLLKYHQTAVNMMLEELQSIAKKAAYEKEIAQKKGQAEEAEEAEQAAEAVQELKSKQTSETLIHLTPEQLHAYLCFHEDPSYEAWLDKVSEKYGVWRPHEKGIPCDVELKKAG